MKRLVIVLGVVAVVLASGVAAATVLSPTKSPKAERKQTRQTSLKTPNAPETGTHGGVLQRFHEAGACSLLDVSTLKGNWTHGDYVSGVAALGDAGVIPEAARSDCGKPMVSVGRRHGPPDSVLDMLKAHKKASGRSRPPSGS